MPRSRARPVPAPEFLEGLYPGPRQAHKALCLWPLLRAPGAPAPAGPECTALADALEDGFVGVEEIDSGASPPALRVQNRAVSAVLVLFGEELGGLSRRRVAHASFLVPAGGEVRIDAACVGYGRRRRRPRELAEMVAAFRPLEAQVGFVAALGEQLLGLEVIGSPALFARVFHGLLEPYALDAVDGEGAVWGGARPGFEAPESLLAGLCAARAHWAGPTSGLGDHLRLRGDAVEGSALTAGGRLVHLRALPTGRAAPSRSSAARRARPAPR